MQQVDDPPSLPVGTEVSAKYKGAFCEAKVRKVVPNIKVKVAYKQGLGSGTVSDDAVRGVLRVGATVEVKHPEKRDWVEATITKIQDCSQYTVVFDDGDITTLRRTALCLKSGRHFNESETLDQLPLTHPEHFGNPVIGGRRGRRSRHLQDDSSDEDDDNDTKEVVNEKEEHIGEVICVESTDSKKKDKDKWFPGLVVAPTAQVTVRIRVKDEYLVRSFKDGRYYTVPKKEAMEFTRELAAKQDGPAVQAALDYLDNKTLPPHWDRDALFGIANSSSEYEGEYDSDSSDDEPREEKDHFVAQLYKYMDDRGTPLNKVPSIANREVDFYRLFRTVQKLGGYNRVTSQNQWKAITMRLGFTPVTVSVTNLVKQAYKKFLQPFVEFDRKLGCSMSMTPRNANRSKGRSLVRANSVASPKPEVKEQKSTTLAEESENTSESSLEATKTKKKGGTIAIGKTKTIPEKYDDKVKEEPEPSPSTKPSKLIKEQPKDEPANTSGTNTPSGHIKREKISKKDNNLPEKKGRKKKEVDVNPINVEKPSEAPPLPPDFPVEVGDKLKVYYHEKKVTYEAKVIEISVQQGTPLYLVHYTGWNNRYDEWVPRERIAENITNSKTKRSKGGITQKKEGSSNLQNEPSRSNQNKADEKTLTPNLISSKAMSASKRGRGRSDSQPPRSTTPSSVASNSSRTKSPATTGRRTTRTQPSTSRRTSNNVSDISMQTDSDTDSDEPVKKPSKPPITTSTTATSNQNSSSLSKTAPSKTTASSTTTNSSEPDEDDTSIAMIAKGRDYDLNQIRSELKGFKELKSPSPETELSNQGTGEIKKGSNVFDFNMTAEDSENEKIPSAATSMSKTSASTTTITTVTSDFKSSSTEPSSETDSFADDDSQSSDKTTTLENMTEKLQQKIKAEKLAQAKCLERINAGKTVEKIIPPPIKSAGIEKIIRDSLAEKMHESLKAKPYLMEKSIYKAIEKEEKLPKIIPEAKIPTPKSVIPEKKLGQLSVISEKKPTTIESKTILSRQERKPINIEKPSVGNKVVPSSSISGTIQKETGFSTESIQFKTPTSSTMEGTIKEVSKLSTTSQQKTAVSSDVYEFKEPEPFEFESRKLQPSGVLVAEQDKKKKTTTTKVSETPTTAINPLQQSNTKKNKKSPTKDPDKAKQLKTDEKCSDAVTIAPSVLSGGPLLIARSETPFDALRKSPSFNLNINALNEELATTVQETTKVLTDVPERIAPISLPSNQKGMQFISPFIETQTDVSKVFDLKEDVENASREKYDDNLPDGKVELETVKKILLSDPGFDLDPPKIEKPSSIADKVLKALNQQKQEEKIKEETVTSTSSFISSPLIVLPSAVIQTQKTNQTIGETSKTPSPFSVTEPPKIELPSVLKKEIEFPLKKPILSSPEHKLDILESIAPKNNDLSETIQKLESAIQKGSNVDHFDEDSSDSTDSERRLVIEDDSRSSDGNHLETSNEVSLTSNIVSSGNSFESKTKQEGNIKEEANTITLKLEGSGKQPQQGQPQQQHHQLQQLNPPNFTPKYPSIFGIQSTVYSDAALLQDAGVKPIMEFVSPSSVATKSKTQEVGEKQQLLEIVGNLEQPQQQRIGSLFQQELQTNPNSGCIVLESSSHTLISSSSPSSVVVTGTTTTTTTPTNIKKEESFNNSQENTNIHTESINLLLCEETIPGSPTPIPTRDTSDTKVNVHPTESDIKPIPMDIECGSSSVPTNTDMPSVKMSGKSNNQTPNSSPRDSISQDDSSEDLKKQLEQDSEASLKKRRRTRKHSESESVTKRRRTNNNNTNSNQQTNSTKKQNGSDSEDNSDANVSQRSSSSRSSRPCQYNFLVQLDPALSPNQRISILKKKIQDLRKTYNMIKAELVSIDRRRKKLRRREREKRNQQKANS